MTNKQETVEEVQTPNAEQEEQIKVSKRIQEVLEEEGFALQPFMQFSEFGVVPRVRLVKVPNETINEEGGDTEETGAAPEQDGATAS